MNSGLYECGLSLEDAFFRKRDAELIEQHKRLDKMKRTRASLAEISGIHDEKVLDKLIELDVSPEILASIAVVPLIEVAWADGEVDEKERQVVLNCAAGNGMAKGSVDYALLENWLKHRPSAKLLDAWVHYISALCAVMSGKERAAFKKDVLQRARKVAKATGGFLGLLKVSPEESAILKTMESAFS